jgi:WhiB family redox-sensing transcriptional regulator
MQPPWAGEAACRGLDPAIFHPQDDTEAEAAKAICGACPVASDCLEHAIERREKEGVWGGMTERERQRIIRRRRRDRASALAGRAG